MGRAMKTTTLLLLTLALCVGLAQAQTGAPRVTVKKVPDDFSRFRAVVQCSGLQDQLLKTNLTAVVFAPNDAAIKAFFDAVGLDFSLVYATRNAMCRAALAYHIVPFAGTAADIKGKDMVVPTLIPYNYLRLNKLASPPGSFTITDMQGNVVRALPTNYRLGPHTALYKLDKVLLSAKMFLSVSSAFAYYGTKLSSFAAALKKTGLMAVVDARGWDGTLFAPADKAGASSKALASLSLANLTALVQYHMLEHTRTIPDGFMNRGKYATLLDGHKLSLQFTQRPGERFGRRVTEGRAMVLSEGDKTAEVVGYNIFAGKAIIHAIDAVLLPVPLSASKSAAAMAATAGHRRSLHHQQQEVDAAAAGGRMDAGAAAKASSTGKRMLPATDCSHSGSSCNHGAGGSSSRSGSSSKFTVAWLPQRALQQARSRDAPSVPESDSDSESEDDIPPMDAWQLALLFAAAGYQNPEEATKADQGLVPSGTVGYFDALWFALPPP